MPRCAARNKLSTILGLLLASQLSATALAHSTSEFEKIILQREAFVEVVDQTAPPFTLRDQEGRIVSLEDYRDKVVVLWFTHAFGPDLRQMQSDMLADIQKQINRTPMRDIVQFVNIATESVEDTPRALSKPGRDPANWISLTSGPEDVEVTRAIAEAYGLIFTDRGEETQSPGASTYLIDRSGALRAGYSGLDFKPTNLILHVNALTNDIRKDAPEQTKLRKWLHEMKELIGID